jgi:ATP-dependent Clp protease protease subunit
MPTTKPWWDIQAKGAKKAEILVYEAIGDGWYGGLSAKRFANDLKALGELDQIDVRINSPGGVVWDGQAIYNTLKSHKATVNVYIDGIAASMASVIAMAGDTITMPENAMMMIHNPLACVCGEAGEMRKMADRLDKTRDTLIAVYEARTGLNRDEISQMMDAETWMTGKEAADLGFADKVDKAVAMAASFDTEIFKNFKNVPTSLLAIQAVGGAQPNLTQNISNQETETMTITLDSIKNDHKDIAQALINEGVEKGKVEGFEKGKAEGIAAGVKNEQERIQALEAAFKGFEHHAELLATLKADGKTTAEQAAAKILNAEREKRETVAKNLKEDGSQAVAASATNAHAETDKGDDPTKATGAISMEEAERLYNSDERVKKEFTSAKNFYSYRKHS